MGLPINKLIVATNENNILHRAITKGNYISKEVRETLSPSMDIQLASNFERLIYYVNNSNSEKTAEIMKKLSRILTKLKRDLNTIQKDFLSESCNEKPYSYWRWGLQKLSFNDCVVLLNCTSM